ncbi:MAG: hypothetical protein AAF404_22145, partial [Pseudomonadota bacterium]
MTRHFAFAAVLFFLSASLHAADAVTPATEFKRALGIIEQTQLEIFTQDKPHTTAQILSQLDNQLNATTDAASQIDVMRSVLADALDQYNDQYANYITPESLKTYREQRTGLEQNVEGNIFRFRIGFHRRGHGKA